VHQTARALAKNPRHVLAFVTIRAEISVSCTRRSRAE
jgi:hypothetical protein